ncbi:MAG: hypothetical protein OEL56_06435 [Nitrosopumilus sp.]|nr:hypothetical protein [Nitrosopumilus sp.]MDH3565158.1 hypothetical protein [Nitrosopumilus sp.]
MEYTSQQIRHSFGILFLSVAVSVATGSILSEIAPLSNLSWSYRGFIWIAVFGLVFGVQFRRFRLILPLIRQRMKKSATWPMSIKILNGICWTLPFAVIVIFPEFTQYLILLGMGFGNISTFVFLKKFSGLENVEQLLVGMISIIMLPVAFGTDLLVLTEHQDIGILFPRLFISVAYAAGGFYALLKK